LIAREIYVVDVSSSDRLVDERHAHEQIEDLLSVAPRGSNVRLVVGRTLAGFAVAEQFMEPAPYWLQLVRDHAVQLEGDARTVRRWSAALEGVAA